MASRKRRAKRKPRQPAKGNGARGTKGTAGPLRPKWDREERELWYGGMLIKRFTGRATLQESVLDAFEEEGWPDEIFDPIRPRGRQKRRLGQIVYNLNQHHKVRRIRFRVAQRGTAVAWKAVA